MHESKRTREDALEEMPARSPCAITSHTRALLIELESMLVNSPGGTTVETGPHSRHQNVF